MAVQLRLWSLVDSPNMPISIKINLLFQIIEIAYPETRNEEIYPQYLDSNNDPDPKTEALLLRNLVSHGGQAGSPQLKKYCNFLGIPQTMNNLGNSEFIKKVESRVGVIKEEARKVIDNQITINSASLKKA